MSDRFDPAKDNPELDLLIFIAMIIAIIALVIGTAFAVDSKQNHTTEERNTQMIKYYEGKLTKDFLKSWGITNKDVIQIIGATFQVPETDGASDGYIEEDRYYIFTREDHFEAAREEFSSIKEIKVESMDMMKKMAESFKKQASDAEKELKKEQ